MYISAQRAMRKRRMIESPSCAVEVMQQPDLGRLGRFTGPASVTLGDIITLPGTSSVSSGFSVSPWLIGGGVLLLGFLLWRRHSAGGSIVPRGLGRKFGTALTVLGAGTGGYLLAKHWS